MTVERQTGRAGRHHLGLRVEFVDTGQAATTDRLVRGRNHLHQSGLVVQRLQDGHRGHGGAVRVGDDALRRVLGQVAIDFAHDEGNLGVHAERAGVVDDDRAGRSELRCKFSR